jgi:hypothetical protein
MAAPIRLTTSFRVHRVLLEQFKQRVPKRGDRSYVMCELLKMYLAGKVIVKPKSF